MEKQEQVHNNVRCSKDNQRVWLLQFCPKDAKLIHRTFGARTDVFLSKDDILKFITEAGVYENVNFRQLEMSDTSDAEYTGVCKEGKLYIFHTTIK